MSDAGSTLGDHADLNKLKVADLKKLLKTRGLSVLGNKQELIDRLQSSEAAAEALIEGSDGDVGDIDEELDREIDEAALDDESTKTEQEIEEPLKEEVKPAGPPSEAEKPAETTAANDKPAEGEDKDSSEKLNGTSTTQDKPKHKRITITDISVTDVDARKKARLERFNQTSAETAPAKTESTDVMSKRAARFAATAPAKTEATSTIVNDPLKTKTEGAAKPDGVVSTDKMKKRAERFGLLSPAEAKKQQLEKLQARKARFAASATPPAATPATTPPAEKTSAPPIPAIKTASSLDEKKRLRAERFKVKT